jgi:hypothetical protein
MIGGVIATGTSQPWRILNASQTCLVNESENERNARRENNGSLLVSTTADV